MKASRPDATGSTQERADRVRSALAGSYILQLLRSIRRWCFDGGFANAVGTSRTAGYVGTGRRWGRQSVLYRIVRSGVASVTATLERWLTNSFGYRWLRADPDPDVIVINLRETATVGPVVRLFERFFVVVIPAILESRTWQLSKQARKRLRAEPLRPIGGVVTVFAVTMFVWSAITGSVSAVWAAVLLGLSAAGVSAFRDRRSWEQLRETRPMTVLAAIFLPPESPDTSVQTDETGDDGEQQATDTVDQDPDSASETNAMNET